MGRHTTPGESTTDQRDEVIGWGAFSTLVAGVLVGVLGGWFEALGVLVLGGLATAALWFVRNHTAAGLGRGRHASDTPWSPSDLLDLKDDDPAAGRVRPAASGSPRAATGRRSRPAGRREGAPVPAGADPLGWLPGGPAGPDGAPAPAGQVTPPAAVPGPSRRSGRRAAPAVVESGGLVDTGGRPVLDAVEPARQVPSPGAGGPGVPATRLPGPAEAFVPPAVLAARAAQAGPTPGSAPPVDPAPARGVPAAREPLSRRSRRGSAGPTGPAAPARPVLPVAPFEMSAGHRSAQACVEGSVPTPMQGVAQVPAGRFPTAPVPVVPAPLAPGHAAAPAAPAATHSAPPAPPPPVPAVPARPVTDPLSGPLNVDTVAAEPTVLDPALDPLWSAPAVELTVEQAIPPLPAAPGVHAVRPPRPALSPDLVAAVTSVELPQPREADAPAAVDLVEAERVDEERARRQPVRRADAVRALREEAGRTAHDRDRAAADLDPLWARRARRPEVRLPGAARPTAARREPAPLEPVPGARAVPPPHPAHDPYAGGAGHDAAASAEPYVVVLPEPDVPDVLMLPESDVVPVDGVTGPTGATGATGADGATGRPAPGTLSLDELLVLHTRRPGARRPGSPEAAGEIGDRPLE